MSSVKGPLIRPRLTVAHMSCLRHVTAHVREVREAWPSSAIATPLVTLGEK